MVLLGRVLFGFVLVGGLRLAWRAVPLLAVAGAAAVLWPSVVLAVGIRRWALPALRLRFPSWRPDLGLSAAALGLVLALGLVGEAVRGAGWLAYTDGLLAPIAVGLRVLDPNTALVYVGHALPWWVAGGLLLGAGWPAYGHAVRAVRPFKRVPAPGGGGPGQRTADSAGAVRPPVPVDMRPVSSQRIATDPRVGMDWLVEGWLARRAITLLVAGPKAGKTELAFAVFRCAYDLLPFCGLLTKPFRVLILTEQNETTLYPFVIRYGFFRVPAGRVVWLRRWWLARVARGGVGNVVEVVTWSSLYRGKQPGDRPTWADIAPAGIRLALRGKYDVLMVDTLGRWAAGEGGGGVASPQAMLTAMGYLHEAADRGLAVLINHHTARAGHAMGTVSIEAEMDVVLKLERAPAKGEDERTTRRVVKGVGRFKEEIPGQLHVRLVDVPDAPAGSPRAHFVGDADGPGGTALDPAPGPAPDPVPSEPVLWATPPGPLLAEVLEQTPAPTTQGLVLQALARAGRATATELGELVDEPLASSPRRRQAVSEALKKLAGLGSVAVVEERNLEGGGKARVYAVTPAGPVP